MIIPIRCFTCGKVVASASEDFTTRVSKGENPKEVLDDLGFDRYCCRRMLLANVDLMDDVIAFG